MPTLFGHSGHLPWPLIGVSLICISLNGRVLAAEPSAPKLPEIVYVSPDQSVWTTKVNAQGEPDNPLLRIAAELFAKAGMAWHAKSYPAARMFSYLKNGSAQFSMLVKAPVLQDCCLVSKKPMTAVEIRAYRRAGTNPVRVIEDLAGKQVITIRGYSYGGLNNFLTDERYHVSHNITPTHASAFRMLASGRADYVIDYSGPASEVLASEPMQGVTYDVLSRQDIYLVLSKTYPDAANVMDRLESIAASMDVEAILGSYSVLGKRAASPNGKIHSLSN